MVPKDLVVFLEQQLHDNGTRLAVAAALANRWQAHLVATFVTQPLALVPHAGCVLGDALSSLLIAHQAELARSLEHSRARFEALTGGRSFTSEWRVSDRDVPATLLLHARHASLAVMGPPARQRAATAALGLSESMVLASGRPCLLLPDNWPAARVARRVVVGWNGGREAARAIADAMPFLVAAEAVHLVVVPDTRTRGLLGTRPGADMATHLARQGVRVEVECLPGDDAGRVLLDRCVRVDADLLVMGALARARVNEVAYGGATRTVLSAVRLPVLLAD